MESRLSGSKDHAKYPGEQGRESCNRETRAPEPMKMAEKRQESNGFAKCARKTGAMDRSHLSSMEFANRSG